MFKIPDRYWFSHLITWLYESVTKHVQLEMNREKVLKVLTNYIIRIKSRPLLGLVFSIRLLTNSYKRNLIKVQIEQPRFRDCRSQETTHLVSTALWIGFYAIPANLFSKATSTNKHSIPRQALATMILSNSSLTRLVWDASYAASSIEDYLQSLFSHLIWSHWNLLLSSTTSIFPVLFASW